MQLDEHKAPVSAREKEKGRAREREKERERLLLWRWKQVYLVFPASLWASLSHWPSFCLTELCCRQQAEHQDTGGSMEENKYIKIPKWREKKSIKERSRATQRQSGEAYLRSWRSVVIQICGFTWKDKRRRNIRCRIRERSVKSRKSSAYSVRVLNLQTFTSKLKRWWQSDTSSLWLTGAWERCVFEKKLYASSILFLLRNVQTKGGEKVHPHPGVSGAEERKELCTVWWSQYWTKNKLLEQLRHQPNV